MIEYVNENTVRLVSNPRKKQRSKKPLNWLEQQMVSAVKAAMTQEVKGQLFLRRQIALADRYAVAVAARNRLKCVGLPGFVSVPVACKIVKPR